MGTFRRTSVILSERTPTGTFGGTPTKTGGIPRGTSIGIPGENSGSTPRGATGEIPRGGTSRNGKTSKRLAKIVDFSKELSEVFLKELP